MTYHFAILRREASLLEAVKGVLGQIGFPERVGRRVFLKPNFTYPFFKEGVTTTREMIVAVVECLKDLGCTRITLGEGDGGYNAFSMDNTFKAYRLAELTKLYGLEVVNVSRWPSLSLKVNARLGPYAVHVPQPVFEEFDTYLNLPVPKVHAMTTISVAVKNQWGLVQDKFRMAFHCAFNEIITEICRRLPTPFAIVDGTYGLTRNGPMIEGIGLELGWVSACDNLWLNDRLICELMKIPAQQVEHLVFAKELGLVPEKADYTVCGDFEAFIDDRFYLRRNLWNRVAKLTWYSPTLNHLVYFSSWSNLLHRLMYAFRSKPKELSVRGVDWH